jgi:phosphatidylglycerophosphate synthase
MLSGPVAMKAGGLFAAIMLIASVQRRTHHPFPVFGPANRVTTVRALLVSIAAALIGEARVPSTALAAAAIATAATLLDGVDGRLARQTKMASPFGARFDMEIDALLVLALSILAWRYDKAGAWVLLSGWLRYLFVAAGWVWPWLRRPLPATFRGKAICIAQIAALVVVLLPAVAPPASDVIAAAALAALGYSFFADVVRLWYADAGADEIRRVA